MGRDAVLVVDNAHVRYENSRDAGMSRGLEGISLSLSRGEVMGLLGPNGAGKSTLIKAILGLLPLRSGSVTFFGGEAISSGVKRRIGFMPEIAYYYPYMTSEEVLWMLGRLSGVPGAELKIRIAEVLKIVGLYDDRRLLIRRFSKGMSERLNFAQSILHDPDLLILDEPFSGLDPLGRIDFRRILAGLRTRGKSILLSSHELSEAELISDSICVIRKGVILARGRIDDLLKDKGASSLEKYFVGMIDEKIR